MSRFFSQYKVIKHDCTCVYFPYEFEVYRVFLGFIPLTFGSYFTLDEAVKKRNQLNKMEGN